MVEVRCSGTNGERLTTGNDFDGQPSRSQYLGVMQRVVVKPDLVEPESVTLVGQRRIWGHMLTGLQRWDKEEVRSICSIVPSTDGGPPKEGRLLLESKDAMNKTKNKSRSKKFRITGTVFAAMLTLGLVSFAVLVSVLDLFTLTLFFILSQC